MGGLAILAFGAAILAGQGQAPSGLPDTIYREVRAPGALPSGAYALAARWDAVKGAQHLSGRPARDAAARSKDVWEARIGVAFPGKPVLYGPYRDVPAGVYVAFVRMRLMDDAGEDPVADLDAAVGFGKTVCAVHHLVGTDMEHGRYAQVPIAFNCPGGKLEIRLHWHGYAGLRLDTVDLYRVENAGPLPAEPRAKPAVPSGLPSNLSLDAAAKRIGDPLPRSKPPVRRLTVCDIMREPPDAQLCALVLQGIINRTRPTVYLLFNESDATWLNWMRRKGWITDTVRCPSWRTLLQRNAKLVRGMVVTDPRLPATKNIANMIAAVENGVVVSPRLAAILKLPVLADLRGRWSRSADAYQWALDTLGSKLNPALAACSYPGPLGLRDYLTQHRAFIFWISGPIDGARPYADPTAEAEVAERILARMPANAPVMSYPWAAKDVGMGEGPGVTLFAEFGKYLVGSVNCSNLSVHSGIRTGALRPRTPPKPRLDPTRVYVSFIMSDGDNLPVLTVSNFPQRWADRARGKVPMGWTISPAAWLLMPDVMSYYYETATANDAFLGAVSGIGYTYPDSYGARYRETDRRSVFDGFLDQTAQYMRESGLRSIWIMNATRPDLIARYAERIPNLEAIFPDYGRRVSDYGEATYPVGANVGVFHAVTGWVEEDTREKRIQRMVEEIRAITPSERPAFLHAFIWNWGADMSIYPEVMKALGPRYVAVRPDHMAHLYREHLAAKQILVRLPNSVAAIEGRRVAAEVILHNVGKRADTLVVSSVGGLTDAEVTPARVALEPGDQAPVRIAGLAASDRVSLTVDSSLGQRMVQVPVRLIGASDWIGPVPDPGTMRFVRSYEAEALAHSGGRAAPDTAGSGVSSWLIEPDNAKPGYVVFGPYAPTPPGRYVAVFRLKRTSEAAGEPLTLDACTGSGARVIGSVRVSPADMPVGIYRHVAVTFDHPGGDLETRLLWPGSTSVALDWVAVWKGE
ncbi:MAG: hypothetical protein GX446_09645 [Chthonomonadales bacterium]|nr:hypothetical protein [Chthonomonadales bacterium]